MKRNTLQGAELQLVTGMKLGPFDACSIKKSAMRAVLVDNDPGCILTHDDSMPPRDQRIAQDQVLPSQTAERGRVAAKNHGVAAIGINVAQHGSGHWDHSTGALPARGIHLAQLRSQLEQRRCGRPPNCPKISIYLAFMAVNWVTSSGVCAAIE